MVISMNVFRPIGDLFLALESVIVGSRIVVHGSGDLSFTTQAFRFLMFCARYADLHWIQYDPSMRLFLLLSTLAVVMLLGYKKWPPGPHRYIPTLPVCEATAILLSSTLFGSAFMYLPTFTEFFWTFSRFIDVLVEIPQLRMLYASERLDKWIITYYTCIGSHVIFYTMSLIYRLLYQEVFDIITPCTTISKGIVIAVFFVVRFISQRRRGPTEVQEDPILDSDTPVHKHVTNEKFPTTAVAAAV